MTRTLRDTLLTRLPDHPHRRLNVPGILFTLVALVSPNSGARKFKGVPPLQGGEDIDPKIFLCPGKVDQLMGTLKIDRGDIVTKIKITAEAVGQFVGPTEESRAHLASARR